MSPSHRIRSVAICALVTATACGHPSSRPISAAVTTTSAPAISVVTSAAPSTTAAVDPEALSKQMQSVVDGFTAAQPVAFSVVVVDLPTGAQAAHLPDRSVLSASLYKLFVARELIRQVNASR